jgi:mitofilin
MKSAFEKELHERTEGIRTDLQEQMNNHVAVLQESHVKELLELEHKLAALHGEVVAFNAAADATDATARAAARQHQNSSAVLALEGALASSKPFAAELAAVRATAAADDDALTLAVVSSIPPTLPAQGAPTLPELRARFAVVRKEVRKAALAPENAPTMIGQLIGTALAMVAPAPKGLVSGSGAEETMSRVAFYLDRGNLPAAVKEVEGVKGYSKVLTNDWRDLAAARLAADQAAVTLRASAMLRHATFAKA